MNWDEALAKLELKMGRSFSLKTQKTYLSKCREFRQWVGKPVPLLTPEDCQAFADEDCSAFTQHVRIHALKFFWERVFGKPLFLKFKKRPRVSIKTDHARIEEIIDKTKYPFKAALCLAYGSGLKLSEILALRREDITPYRVRLPDRLLPISKSYWPHIKHHLGQHNSEYMFPSTNPIGGKVMSPSYLQRNIDITIRELRHGFAQRLVRKGVGIQMLQKAMGHATVESTVRYYL